MELNYILGIVGIVVFCLLLCLKVPISFAMLIVGFVGMIILSGWNSALSLTGTLFYSKVASYTLSLIPMFILMGNLASDGQIGADAYELAHRFVGHFRGGIGYVTCIAGALFGAACGSSMASAITLGKLAIPEMRKLGYDDGFSGATVASAGLLAMTIPPSMMMVIYAVSVNASVGSQLMAGVIPGVVTAIAYCITIAIWVRFRPNVAPRGGVKYSWRQRFAGIGKIVPILVLFAAVMLSMYLGFATPTEAGALGVFAAFVFVVIRKKSKWASITSSAIRDTVINCCFIFIIMAGAGVFSLFLNRSGIVDWTANAAIGLQLPDTIKMGVIILVLIPVGMFLDGMSAMLITLPILYPIAIALGFDPIVFGVVLMLMIELGLLTPPVGMNVYALVSASPDVDLKKVFGNIWPFCIAILAVVYVLMAFPQITLFLPHLVLPH